MHYEQQEQAFDETQCPPPPFACFDSVQVHQRVRIVEDLNGDLEPHAVLALVRRGLRRIPRVIAPVALSL
jgi:hypothetical protein